MRGGAKVAVTQHRHEGVYIARGKEDALCTKNMVPGESVYGEKRVSVENEGEKTEYRVWNPFRSKLGAGILGGVGRVSTLLFLRERPPRGAAAGAAGCRRERWLLL